jgi:hypothetical protein
VLGDAPSHQVQRLDRHAEDAARVVPPELGLDDGHVAGQAVQRLAAVAPAGAAAQAIGFEQSHRPPLARDLERGRQAGQAAADHGHVAAGVAIEGRCSGAALGRALVPAIAREVAVGVAQAGHHGSFAGGATHVQPVAYRPAPGAAAGQVAAGPARRAAAMRPHR